MQRKLIHYLIFFVFMSTHPAFGQQTLPDQISFTRQAVRRLIFDEGQSIPLAKLDPQKIVGMESMHPVAHYLPNQSEISIEQGKLVIESAQKTQTATWMGGFNPFSTYTIDLNSCAGEGELGFEFSDPAKKEQIFITIEYKGGMLTGARLRLNNNTHLIKESSITVPGVENTTLKGRIILQMLGSGLVLYLQKGELPQVIGQADFNKDIDLRSKERIHTFQSHLFSSISSGKVSINKAGMALTTGTGQADIRAITYENGEPLLDQGRLWYTMSIRGRALPHHIQGVFSMDPTVFDVKLEGIIVFDRNDGLLRNEVASHIFFDRRDKIWRGITTGFSAYANPDKEKKQLLTIESRKDPRFGFSVMTAAPFGIVGDIEDPHILFDEQAKKWRILTCENHDGYKAVILESAHWNKGYKKIAGPVAHNSTGTSIQKIDGRYYCFSGSSERQIFIYTYPDLREAGVLKMDLPPWSETSGTRVWPNVVQLPEGYPFRFVALMMDRFNYPGLSGPNWTYGALYLYRGK
ncbi:hypothetical protein [Pedobacter faecalis]|uniref:hypothetical protein n=1 Tax=Pedobacter faecalis TaxID=3041495 RepID=UPI00254D79A1|nr:hypothetical protein [Pedobacter sp. ELA7]